VGFVGVVDGVVGGYKYSVCRLLSTTDLLALINSCLSRCVEFSVSSLSSTIADFSDLLIEVSVVAIGIFCIAASSMLQSFHENAVC
jgi:hypothetical protein|tara:strand:- start:3434 stop:3691 length:258 start_codon:yes stop_codon:yes gene_type:complete